MHGWLPSCAAESTSSDTLRDTLRDRTNQRHNSGDKESVRLPSLQTDLSRLMKVYVKHPGNYRRAHTTQQGQASENLSVDQEDRQERVQRWSL